MGFKKEAFCKSQWQMTLFHKKLTTKPKQIRKWHNSFKNIKAGLRDTSS